MVLILPGHPLFDITLATPPPDWKIKQQGVSDALNFVKDSSSGVFRTVSPKELDEYLWGGEYDEVIGEDEEILWDG
jgi:hypothetical protein